MNVLITHESSGVVRRAFRALGHNAWSCDLLPAADGSHFHLQTDVFNVVNGPEKWDLIGMHPPCTFLSGSGIHWNNRGRGWEKTERAIADVSRLLSLNVPYYLENPVGIISTRIRKPDQCIQPYNFGEDASKKTCLWLNRLPLLVPTKHVDGRIVEWPRGSGKMIQRWSNQTDSGQNKLTPSEDRWSKRSVTYQGIAGAMADQWGS